MLKDWWYWLFHAIFLGFILITLTLFSAYKLEGEYPGTLNESLLNIWWGSVLILLMLLFLKRKSEKFKSRL